ncbi:MAG: CvpA family protein, partial [Ruminococcaceae bacterium]|nr:CvpA family protein [Oscillospiraceae bacterium]
MTQNYTKPSVLSIILRSLGALATDALLYYFMLPPINPHSKDFWIYLTVALAVLAVYLGGVRISALTERDTSPAKKKKKNIKIEVNLLGRLFPAGALSYVLVGLALLPLLILFVGSFFSSPFINAREYAAVITVDERDFDLDMPEIDQVTNIALMDTDSARILGNRMLGALSGVVSQYVASDSYTQINYHGKPMKVTNLEYDGFFKWINNCDKGIPGYVTVDPVGNTAEFCELPQGMIYSHSGYFSHDLVRKLRFSYPTKIFQSISFEIDEEGNVYYIVSCAS